MFSPWPDESWRYFCAQNTISVGGGWTCPHPALDLWGLWAEAGAWALLSCYCTTAWWFTPHIICFQKGTDLDKTEELGVLYIPKSDQNLKIGISIPDTPEGLDLASFLRACFTHANRFRLLTYQQVLLLLNLHKWHHNWLCFWMKVVGAAVFFSWTQLCIWELFWAHLLNWAPQWTQTPLCFISGSKWSPTQTKAVLDMCRSRNAGDYGYSRTNEKTFVSLGMSRVR